MSEQPVTDEARNAAHEATACNLGEPGWTQMLGKSPHDLIDIALDAAAPLIRADERRRIAAGVSVDNPVPEDERLGLYRLAAADGALAERERLGREQTEHQERYHYCPTCGGDMTGEPSRVIAEAVAAERERIRQLAIKHSAICPREPDSAIAMTTGNAHVWTPGSDLPPIILFADLLGDPNV